MRFFLSVCLVLTLFISVLPAHTAQAAGVVEPANMQDWYIVDDNEVGGGRGDFTRGPAAPPAGQGSAHLVLENTSAGWIFTRAMNAGTPLANITRLEYSTYTETDTSTLAVALQINVDYDLTDTDNGWQGRLVYEPYRNGTVTSKTWQTWNTAADSANWFASGGAGAADCPMNDPCTWAEVLANFPNIGFHPTYGAIAFKAGSSWGAFDGNFDQLIIGIDGVDDSFDFEPPTTVYVDDWSAVPYNTDPDDTGPAHLMGLDAFATVQGGVNAVAMGGTIHVAEGTYEEQVIARNFDGLTIEGAGQGLTILQSPTTLTSLVGDRKPVLGIESSANVTIRNLTVDGAGRGGSNYRMFGVIYHNSDGLMDHLTVQGIRNEPLNGSQHGVAIYALNDDSAPRTVTTRDCLATDYQKGGFAYHGVGLMAVVDHNTAQGVGPTGLIAMNGIQISGGASGEITGNTVTGHSYTGPSWSASGILLYGPAGTANLSNNLVEENQVGIYGYMSSTLLHNQVNNNEWGLFVDTSNADVTANTFTNNEYAIDVAGDVNTVVTAAYNRIVGNTIGLANEITVNEGETIPSINAVNNWWGCNAGPDTTDCDTTSGPVTAGPWLVLSLTADSNHALPNSPVNLVASITSNSDGADLSSAPAFPDGKEIAFAASVGTVTPALDPMELGASASVLSVDDTQPLTTSAVSATLDNETITLNIAVGMFKIRLPIIIK